MGQDVVAPSGKSAGLATLLSCILPGVGQIYLGQVIKGIVILAADIVLGCTVIIPLVIWIVAMIDANKIGKKLEAGQSVQQWEFF